MLKLVQTELGIFDLAFDDPTLIDEDAAVATVVYATIFTDQEAPASRVPDRFDRRGWYDDAEAGTGLWYLRRQALTGSARAEAVAMIADALKNRAPGLTDIAVKEVFYPETAGSVSSVFLEISGLHNGRQFVLKVPLNPA